jgi:PAS domain S-box-containing protein
MGRITNSFAGFKVNTKLFILNGILIASLILMASLSGFLFKTSRFLTIIVSEEKVFTEYFQNGIEEFYKYNLSGDKSNLDKSFQYFDKASGMVFAYAKVDSIIKAKPRKEWVPYFTNFFGEGLNNDVRMTERLINEIRIFSGLNQTKLKETQQIAFQCFLLGNKVKQDIVSYNLNKTDEKFRNLQTEFESVHDRIKEMEFKIHALNQSVSQILSLILVSIVIILGLITWYFTSKVGKSISKPIFLLAENFKLMSKGNLKSTVRIESKNEVGELSDAFSSLREGLLEIIGYSKQVADGDYSLKLNPKSDDDELTPALNRMAENLEVARLESNQENWMQKGLSGLDEKMRGNFTVREISQKIITYISEFLGVQLGAVYVYDDVLNHLEFTGSIGLDTKEIKNSVSVGEGLIGKAASQNFLQILDTKEKYHKIYSATGEMNPAKLYLLPLFYNGRIQAVIELAAVNELSEIKLEFLKQACDSISINLNASVARYRHSELLDKTLEQSAVLQAREEELNIKLNEIQEIQEKLSRQKALLDAMLNTLPDYIYFKDTDSRFLRISQSMVKLFGVNIADEIIGKTDFDFHTPENARLYFEEEQEMIRKGEGFIDVIREGVNEKGEVLWTSVTKLPMYDEHGVCIGTFGISKDVTKIKILEIKVKKQYDQLLTNKEKLEQTIDQMDNIQAELVKEKLLVDSLLENIPDSIYFKDLESKFLKVSKSMMHKFLTAGKKDILGLTDFDIQDSVHAKEAFEDEQEIIKTGKPKIGYTEKELKQDGTVRYVLSTKMPYFDDKGKVIGTFGISRDITKLKELEIEINEQNSILQEQQEELKTANEELKSQEEELRVANEELAEQTKILLESEKSLQQGQEELRVANEELELKTNELEIQRNDIFEKNQSLIKIQEELKQKARELELASTYKSEFLANMSHELRTPLNSMLILSKLMANNKSGNLTEEQLKSITIIHKSGKDLLELINEILDLSKIEAGKMTFEFAEAAADDIKTEIKQGFKPVAESKRLSLEINIAKDFPNTIYTDRQRLMQIMKNLLSNAFKFTNSGGIKVKMGYPSKNVRFNNDYLNSNNTIFIAVEDSGVGIPQNKVEAIFEAFQQADGSISRRFGGTGLGLSISKQLTRALGGEIHVESTEGIGSEFTIYLPTDRDLIGKDFKERPEKGGEANQKVDRKETPITSQKTTELINAALEEENRIPYFINDDRDSELKQLLVLIIHPDKGKAKQLLGLCHKRKFQAIVSGNIPDGINLAMRFLPKAIILSAEIDDPKEFEKLKKNQVTSRLPLHFVTKIEDSSLDSLEELKTPETVEFNTITQQISSPLGKEYNQILVVEDDLATLESIHLLFKEKDIIIHEAKNGQQAFDLIATKSFDCIILDLGLPDFSGEELLKRLTAENIPIPNVIIHTARELSQKELRDLRKYSDSVVIKGIKSDERLMDEVSLFLHQVATSIPKHARPPLIDELENSGFKGKKILVVDDDIRNIFAIAQILEEKEIEVLEAENGEDALNIIKENNDIDLVLMDIMMPIMDGYETMKKIRETPGKENIPIITLTAKAMKEDYQKAIDFGANDYISKPVDIDKLLSLIKIWLFKKTDG